MPLVASDETLPRRLRPLRWLPWIAIAGLLVVLLCHEWFGPDIWYHLYLGGRIAESLRAQPGDHLLLQQPAFINVYWLFQLLARGIFALGGLYAVSGLFIIAWSVAFAAWLRVTGAARAGAWGLLTGLTAVLVCQTRFEQRPEVFSYAFLALQVYWLSVWPGEARPARKEFLRFALVQVIWSNVHGYFVFGPLLVAARLAAAHLGPRAPASPRTTNGLWQLLGLTALASLVSPFGLRNWENVFTLTRYLRDMQSEVQELLPPTGTFMALWTVKLFWLGWTATLLTGIFVLLTTPRRAAFALLLAAAGLWLSATSFRNIPLLVFLGAPLAAIGLRGVARLAVPDSFAGPAVGVTCVALGSWAIAGGFYESMASPAGFGIRESPAASPVRFADYLRSTGFRGMIFNNPSDGGYLEFHFPDLRLYGDSRLVEASLVRPYLAALKDPAVFADLDHRHAFDAVLLPVAESGELVATLLHSGEWTLAYADLHRAFLVNARTAAAAAAIRREPEVYHGENLALRRNGLPAIQWTAIFATLGDRRGLLRTLQQFSPAQKIPSVVLEYALRFGLMTSDREVIAAARALRPKMLALSAADAESVDALLQQAL